MTLADNEEEILVVTLIAIETLTLMQLVGVFVEVVGSKYIYIFFWSGFIIVDKLH